MVCSYLDRVGFLWRHKIPLPNQGVLLWMMTFGPSPTVLAAPISGKEAVDYTGGPAWRGHFFVAGLLPDSSSSKTEHTHGAACFGQRPAPNGRPAIPYVGAGALAHCARRPRGWRSLGIAHHFTAIISTGHSLSERFAIYSPTIHSINAQ